MVALVYRARVWRVVDIYSNNTCVAARLVVMAPAVFHRISGSASPGGGAHFWVMTVATGD